MGKLTDFIGKIIVSKKDREFKREYEEYLEFQDKYKERLSLLVEHANESIMLGRELEARTYLKRISEICYNRPVDCNIVIEFDKLFCKLREKYRRAF